MSKKSSSSPRVGEIGYGDGLVISSHIPNCIVGGIMPIIEIMGLSEKQELALKDQIKQVIRKEFQDSVWINSEQHTKIRSEYKKDMNIPCGSPI